MKKEKAEGNGQKETGEGKKEAKPDEMKCASCGRRVESEADWVEFQCPGCGDEKILRCGRCKTQMVTYSCKCGFEGP